MKRFSTTLVCTESPILTQARIAQVKMRRAALELAKDGLRRAVRPGPRRMVFTGADAVLLP